MGGRAGLGGAAPLEEFAVNLMNKAESDLRPPEGLTASATAAETGPRRAGSLRPAGVVVPDRPGVRIWRSSSGICISGGGSVSMR